MRRHVFYIHGFDPRGPAPYHAICAEAAALKEIEISARRKASAVSAQWELRCAGGETRYEVLRYDDWVRALWPRWKGARRYGAALRVVFHFARAGVLSRLARSARPTFWAVLAQGFAGAVPFAVALALGAGGFVLARHWFALPYAVGSAVLLTSVLSLIGRRWEARLNLAWFTRSLAYILESARGEIEEPSERTALFALRILEEWRKRELDEIVVVGHSLGAVLAVATLAKALQLEPQCAVSGPPISLLTLGQAVPIFSQLDATGKFEREAADVARAFPWLDVTSPYDAASSGAIPILREGSDRIASLPTHHIDGTSAGFRRFLQPLEFHFRYLRSADPERGFDYLTLLLGPKRIARREPTPATPPRAAASA